MKKLLLSAAVIALSAGAALAADLPSRKAPPMLPPPPPPPPMWTGFYAGLNAGYNFGTNSNIQSIAAETTDPGVSLGGFFVKQTTAQGAFNLIPYGVNFPATGAGLAQSGSFANTQNG